jgi:Domain of unknown function (DUF4389)
VRVMPDPGAGPAPVLVAVGNPADQRRLTVAGRLVLCVPHLLVLAWLAPAALALAVVGWFGALATGRLPRLCSDFLSGWLGFQSRLLAYLFLLTDVYPPFSLGDGPYPVRVTTRPATLNRLAVAFRLVLALPALVVATTVTYGTVTVFSVLSWIVVLVTGRLPDPLHQVFAGFVRYQARVAGYLTMVTTEYPWGLLGDTETGPPAAAAGPVPAGSVVGATVWQPAPPSPVDDPYWRVVLSARAKNLTVFVVVLGVASVAFFNIATAVSRYDRLHTDEAAGARVQSAYQALSTAVIGYESETRSCDGSGVPLPCLTAAASDVSRAFSVFDHRLSTTTMPPGAVAARDVVVADGARAERDFAQLSTSSSAGHYQLVIESTDLPQLLSRFDRNYEVLGAQLDNLG